MRAMRYDALMQILTRAARSPREKTCAAELRWLSLARRTLMLIRGAESAAARPPAFRPAQNQASERPSARPRSRRWRAPTQAQAQRCDVVASSLRYAIMLSAASAPLLLVAADDAYAALPRHAVFV